MNTAENLEEGAELEAPAKTKRRPRKVPDGVGTVGSTEDGDTEATPKIRSAPTRRIPANKESTLVVLNTDKAATYKGKRMVQINIASNSRTIADFKVNGGDMSFLSFFVQDGTIGIEEA